MKKITFQVIYLLFMACNSGLTHHTKWTEIETCQKTGELTINPNTSISFDNLTSLKKYEVEHLNEICLHAPFIFVDYLETENYKMTLFKPSREDLTPDYKNFFALIKNKNDSTGGIELLPNELIKKIKIVNEFSY